MKQQNKPTVYISYSLKDNFKRVEVLQEFLEKKGLHVIYYRRGTEYSDKLLLNADYVLFLPLEGSVHPNTAEGNLFHTKTSVGRGQHSEAELCYKKNKDAFMIHTLNKEGDLFVAKLTDRYRGKQHFILNSDSWKSDYGQISSHSLGGYFHNFWDRVEIPTEVQNSLNKKLLLLLD